MKILKMRTNHLENPLGFATDQLTFSWVVTSTGKKQKYAQVEIALDMNFCEVLYDSGMRENISGIAYHPSVVLAPRTRYYWRVTVVADNGDSCVSETAWFETGKKDEPWKAEWIAASFDKETSPLMKTVFSGKDVVSAKIYICGLGSYELYMNGEKVSDDLLAPGHHSYDLWLQAFTYDLMPYIKEENALGVILSKAWYMGRFGCGGGFSNIYGDQMKMIAEIHLQYADGSEKVIPTDADWLCKPSAVIKSSIYYGEDFDARKYDPEWALPCGGEDWKEVAVIQENDHLGVLHDRYSPPVTVHEQFAPVEVIKTPLGENVLDFGQNMTGWVEMSLPALEPGTKVQLYFSEVMQDGCFYRNNLRLAECQYTYISDGKPAKVRPHGTFYGFRFVKVEGIEPEEADFIACEIHSDIQRTGWIETDDSDLNRLFLNALWGQKDNFLDVPTDCPQRDERLGWTGDAQIFAGTACFNMYTPAFYAKYMEDLMLEQNLLDGGIPFTIPAIRPKEVPETSKQLFIREHSSTAWGDAACVIPWTLYNYYGDKELLRRHYPAMTGWVEYIYKQDEKNGGHRLWQSGFHFADWLSLDNYLDPETPFGATDAHYIASAYYFYSTCLTAKAAKELGYEQDYKRYEKLSAEIREAILNEYFSPNGRCTINTQTAHVVALYFDIVPEKMKPQLTNKLKELVHKPLTRSEVLAGKKEPYPSRVALTTGFVGTPYLCPTLSRFDDSLDAYSLLLKTDYPSWLYEVKMGATTIWERWNSIMPDGHMNPAGMNSLNHYAYGSIVEWMYRYMCGLNEMAPGFRRVRFQPCPDPENRIGRAQMVYDSVSGQYQCGWEKTEKGYCYNLTVPFDCEAEVILPGGTHRIVDAGCYQFAE